MNRRQFIKNSAAIAGLISVSGLPLLSACSSSSAAQMTMQSAWINDAEFLGYFIAIQKEYYENNGITLEYLPGGPEVIPDTIIFANKAEVGLTTPDVTVGAIVKEGAPFKIIGTQYQKNPIGVVSLKENNINEPKDLIGKTLAVPAVNVITVEAMLKLNSIAKEDVRIVPYKYDPTPLIKGEVDATIDFVTNVPYSIREQGAEPNSFLLYDYGFKIFNDTVVVLEETLKSRRKDLISWLRASRQGWEENFKDTTKYPKQFMDSYFEGTGRTLANEEFFNNAQKELIEHPNGIFSMTEESINENIESLNQIGLAATRDMFVTDLLEEI